MEEHDIGCLKVPKKDPLHHRGNGWRPNNAEDIALLDEESSPMTPAEFDHVPAPVSSEEVEIRSTPPTHWDRAVGILHKNLLPDLEVIVAWFPMVEGEFTVKLLKFVLLTFGSIALVHTTVKHITDDRDRSMTLFHIWRYDTNLIVMDCVVFFLVGRLWRQVGVDCLAWILPMTICNIYFQCHPYISWLQHSVSLFEIHCVWPWQLWIFVLLLVPAIGSVVLAHVHRAWSKRVLLIKLVELSMCTFFFLAPVMSSRYFHLHHWFAGWLLGMHCNFDVWWSRVVMAYCWVSSQFIFTPLWREISCLSIALLSFLLLCVVIPGNVRQWHCSVR